jgi:adenylate cyclase
MAEIASAKPLFPNPLTNWIIETAHTSASISDLVTNFAEEMVQNGIPLMRLSLHIRTIHPLIGATGLIWRRGHAEVLQNNVGHEVFKSDRFLKSPVMPIYEGAEFVRRRLFLDDHPFDFPILEEVYCDGGTDYVAMPMLFSDGQINAVTLSSDQTTGFSDRDIDNVKGVIPVLGRLVEVFASRYKMETLLETYLGHQAGSEVLNGMMRQGDGRDIHAVIWFCDLRDSTALADALPRMEFLKILNEFFDCVAGAVIRYGGEVLRFIGDAILAIFPVEEGFLDSYQSGGNGCTRALKAATDATEKIRRRNNEAAVRGDRVICIGIGLHIGDVTYGNIGTDSRLEFTVIGSAVNETARIESLCKATGEVVLVSAEFARQNAGAYRPLGFHHLNGVEREIEVFAPADLTGISQQAA